MRAGERTALVGFLLVAGLLGAGVSDEYLLHIGVLILIYAILATSLNLIVGYVGEFPLGHVAFFGTGAYAAALFSVKLGMPIWATLALGGIVAALFGFVIGAITLRLQGPYFVIVTLAFAEVLRVVATNWVGLTNGPMGLPGIPHPAFIDGAGFLAGKRGFFYITLALVALAFFVSYRFVYSNAGRAAVTIRENRYVAQSVGVQPWRYAMFAFVLASFLAGIAGASYGHYVSFVGPEVFGFSFTATMIIMVLLGGKGTLVGPVIGAVAVTLLEEYLREAKELRLTLFGLIVMAVVLFAPQGVAGALYGRLRMRARQALRRVRHA
jgi:branched-chain amino acid transport system permease protein